MTRNSTHHTVFKRLETDVEFRKRLIELDEKKSGKVLTYSPLLIKYRQELDDYGWNEHRVQRRIVEDVA